MYALRNYICIVINDFEDCYIKMVQTLHMNELEGAGSSKSVDIIQNTLSNDIQSQTILGGQEANSLNLWI
jgi:hypothetical protein